MSPVAMAVFAVALPAAVAAWVVALGRVLGRRRDPSGGGPWWAASAVGLAYLAGHVAVARPAVPPADVTDRIPWLALAATALALFEAFRSPGLPARAVGRSLLAVLTLWLVLGPVLAAGDLSREMAVTLAASAAVALLAWADLEALAAWAAGADVARALLITAAGAGPALLLSGSAVLGQLGAALAAALAAAWLATRGRPPAGAVPVAAALLTALVLEGHVYAALPGASALLLAAAPAGVWLTRLGPVRRLGPRAVAALGSAAVLVPVAVAVGLAVSSSPSTEY
jgi:hypothetical protein